MLQYIEFSLSVSFEVSFFTKCIKHTIQREWEFIEILWKIVG